MNESYQNSQGMNEGGNTMLWTILTTIVVIGVIILGIKFFYDKRTEAAKKYAETGDIGDTGYTGDKQSSYDSKSRKTTKKPRKPRNK